MADTNANIRIGVDTSEALVQIKNLQRQISLFHSEMVKGGAASAAASAQLRQSLINTINSTGRFSAEMTRIKSTAESFTTALEKNKLSMGQYFRYAGASTKTFGSLFKNEFNTINKVARERVKDLQTQYIKMGRDASGALQAIKVRPLTLDMQNYGTQVAMAAQRQQIFNQLIAQGSTNLLNWGKNTQWAGRQLMVGFTIPLTIMGSVAAKEFMKIEKQAIRFRRVYGEMFTTSAETEQAIQNVRQLADEFTKYGVEVEKTLELAADAAQMGLMGAELTAQVTNATRLAVLGEVEQQEALQATISVTNAFGVAAEDLAGKIDFLNAVENQTMVAISDLTTAIPKAGPVVKQLGGSVEDLAFFLAAMREGGINASEGANALKSGLARIINPTERASQMLGELGINITGIVEGNAGNIRQTLIDLSNALNELDPLNRARAIEELFGKFQFARISTLFQNITKEGSQASRVLELTRSSAEELAVLSERELKKVEDSPVFKFEKAIERIQASLAPVGEAFLKAVTPVIEFGTKILEKFNNMSDGAKTFIVAAAAIGGAVAPALLMIIGLVANGIANLIKFGQLIAKYFGMAGGSSQVLGEQTEYLTQQQIEQLAASASLEQAHMALAQAFTSEAMAVETLTAAYNEAIIAQQAYNNAAGASAAGGAAAAAGAAARGGQKPMGLANGILSVPGRKGDGDVVPAMLSPGEAVIPKNVAEKYRPLIQGIIADNIPGFARGTANLGNVQVSARTQKQADQLSSLRENMGEHAHYLDAMLERVGTVLEDGSVQLDMAFDDFKRMLTEEVLVAGESNVGGMSQTNLARAHLTDPLTGALRQQGLEQSGFSVLPPGLQENVSVVSNLVAELPQRLNMMLRPGGGGASEDFFSKVWSAREGKLDVSAAAGGVDLGNAEELNALRETEVQIGQEAINVAREQTAAGEEVRVTDEHLAEATRRVIEARKREEGASRKVAEALESRANMVGQVRSNQTRESVAPFKDRLVKTGKGDEMGYMLDDGTIVPGVTSDPSGSRATRAGSGYTPSGSYRSKKVKGQSFASQKVVKSDALDDAQIYNKTIEENTQDIYMASRDRSSPHPQASQDGIDDQVAYEQGRRQGSGKGNLRPPTPPPVVPAQQPGKARGLLDRMMLPFAKRLARGSGASITDSQGNLMYDASTDPKSTQYAIDQERQLAEARRQAALATEQDTAATKENITVENASTRATDANTEAERRQTQQETTGTATQQETTGTATKTRRGIAGGLSGGLFMAGSVAMGASMMGGPVGEMAGKVAGPMMAVGAVLPLLGKMPPALQAIIVVLGLLAYAGYKVVTAFRDTAKRIGELEDALGRGRKAMDTFAEFSGKVTASQIMDRRRAGGLDPFQVAAGKKTQGQVFFEGEDGQELLKNVEAGILQFGKDQTINKVFMQLGQAVASGALDTATAMSISSEIGAQLDDLSFGIGVNSKLMTLIDPTGKDLLIDPISLQAEISVIGQENLEQLISEGPKSMSESWLEGDQMQQMALDAYGFGAYFNKQFWEGFFREDKLTGWFFNQQDNVARMAEIIGAANNQLEGYQQELDTIEIEYGKKIEAALESNDSAAYVDDLRAQQLAAEEDALARRQQTITTALAERATDAGKFDLAMKQSLSTMFEGDTLKQAESLFNKIDSVIGDEAKVAETRFLLTTGDIPLTTITDILDNWDEQPEVSAKRLELVTNFGKGMSQEIEQVLALIKDPALQGEYLNIFDPNNLAQSQQDLEALTAIGRVAANTFGGEEVKQSMISAYVDGPGAAEARQRLNRDLAKLDQYEDQIMAMDDLDANADFFITTFGQEAFAIAQLMWDQVEDGEQKNALYTILTMLDADTTGAYDELLGQEGNTISQILIEDKKSAMAAQGAQYLSTLRAASSSIVDDFEETAEGAGKTASALDDIVKKLRDVRMNQILFTEGWEDSMARLEELFGGDRNISIFSGLEQDMRRLGAGEDLITLIAGMPPEEFERRKNELFTFDAAGNIAGVTTRLQTIAKAMRAIALGDYQNTQEKTLATLNDQITAVRKLTAAGLSLAQAYEAVQDATFAAAVAREKDNGIIRETIKLTKQAIETTRAFEAAQALARKNQESSDLRGAVSFIERNARTLSEAQKSAIMDDPDLQTLVMNPSVDPKTLRQALANAEAKADLELRIKKLTFEGLVEVFNEGFNNAMQAFSVKEKEIELDFDVKREPFLEAIKEAEEDIADIRNRAGGLDDLEADLERIARKEEEINEAYDARKEALDEVKTLNEQLAKQQESQLDVAEALSRGDIAAAAKAAQGARQQQVEASQQKLEQQLEIARERELAALVGETGMTRIQLEEQIKRLNEQIFDIEEKRLEPAQYQIELLDREQQKLIESLTVLGKTREEWERIQNRVELAVISSDKFTKSLEEALNVVEDITTYWDTLEGSAGDAFAGIRQEIRETIDELEDLIATQGIVNNYYGGGSGGKETTDNIPDADYQYPGQAPGWRPPMAPGFDPRQATADVFGFGRLTPPTPQSSANERVVSGMQSNDPNVSFEGTTGTLNPYYNPAQMMPSSESVGGTGGYSPLGGRGGQGSHLPQSSRGFSAPTSVATLPTQLMSQQLDSLIPKTNEVVNQMSLSFGTLPVKTEPYIVGGSGIPRNLTSLSNKTPSLLSRIGEFFTKDLPNAAREVTERKIPDHFTRLSGNATRQMEPIETWINRLPGKVEPKLTSGLSSAFQAVGQSAPQNLNPIPTWFGGLANTSQVRQGVQQGIPNTFGTAATQSTGRSGLGRILDWFGRLRGQTQRSTASIPSDFGSRGNQAGGSFSSMFMSIINRMRPSVTVRVNYREYNKPRYLKNNGGYIMRNNGGMATFANGGFPVPMMGVVGGFGNYDNVPALLTPGEFVVRKEAVQKYGQNFFEALNSTIYSKPDLAAPSYSVSSNNYESGTKEAQKSGVLYNNSYQINVNVKSESNPDQIARTVMQNIKRMDSQRIRSNRL